MIKKLSDIDKRDINTVGGKAANLGDLYRNGFNVPNGFVVTTHAYDIFLSENHLKDKMIALLQGLDIENTTALVTTSGEIKRMFEMARLSPRLETQNNQLLVQFASNRFAVRSSAVTEDLPGASFAGQMDSFLEVPRGEVNARVKSVFASLFNERAIYYRQMKGFSHDVGIAVIIQEMIPSEFSGVLFTRDPINKTHIMIELAPGLGENVVSGLVSPNNYLVNRDNFYIETLDESEQFDQQKVKQIARIGLEIEKHFTQPQDMEFAVVKEKIFILQSRPITVSI